MISGGYVGTPPVPPIPLPPAPLWDYRPADHPAIMAWADPFTPTITGTVSTLGIGVLTEVAKPGESVVGFGANGSDGCKLRFYSEDVNGGLFSTADNIRGTANRLAARLSGTPEGFTLAWMYDGTNYSAPVAIGAPRLQSLAGFATGNSTTITGDKLAISGVNLCKGLPSTTSNTIGTGSPVTFAVGANKQINVNDHVHFQAIKGSNSMSGTVSAYSGGNVTFTPDRAQGSGTFASWRGYFPAYSQVYLKPSGAGQSITPDRVHPCYIELTLPALSAGTYGVRVHNMGGGSKYGWSAPLTLTIDTAANLFINYSDEIITMGAPSGGDDYSAINTALGTASHTKPITLTFLAGTYKTGTKLLGLIAGGWPVLYLGAGEGSTTIKSFAGINANDALFQNTGGAGTIAKIQDMTIDTTDAIAGAEADKPLFMGHWRYKNVTVKAGNIDSGINSTINTLLTSEPFVLDNVHWIGGGIFAQGCNGGLVVDSDFELSGESEGCLQCWSGNDYIVARSTFKNYGPSAVSSDSRQIQTGSPVTFNFTAGPVFVDSQDIYAFAAPFAQHYMKGTVSSHTATSVTFTPTTSDGSSDTWNSWCLADTTKTGKGRLWVNQAAGQQRLAIVDCYSTGFFDASNDPNKGEWILSEGRNTSFQDTVASATSTTMTFTRSLDAFGSDPSTWPNSRHVAIVDKTGTLQNRLITAVNQGTKTIAFAAMNVVADNTSVATVMSPISDVIVYNCNHDCVPGYSTACCFASFFTGVLNLTILNSTVSGTAHGVVWAADYTDFTGKPEASLPAACFNVTVDLDIKNLDHGVPAGYTTRTYEAVWMQEYGVLSSTTAVTMGGIVLRINSSNASGITDQVRLQSSPHTADVGNADLILIDGGTLADAANGILFDNARSSGTDTIIAVGAAFSRGHGAGGGAAKVTPANTQVIDGAGTSYTGF